MAFRILSAGAAKGLVQALRPQFSTETGVCFEESFGAVGAMKAKLLAGEACDVIVLTAKLIDELTQQGYLEAGSAAPLGRVATGIAVRAGEPQPELGNAAHFKASLQAAQGIYFPDPERSTAGMHLIGVLQQLELHEQLKSCLRPYPSGAMAMRELANSSAAQLIGCAQITEVHYTEGITLVGSFPKEFELTTVYSVAVCRNTAHPELAHSLVELLAGPRSERLRTAGGFEL